MDARALACAAGLATLAGCCGMCAETTRSENVRTEGMRADVRVESYADLKTHVYVSLRVGGSLSNVYPEVTGADRLEATASKETIPLPFSRNVVQTPSHHGIFSADTSGQTVEIRFLRSANTSALGTRVVMPPPLTVTGPAPGTELGPGPAVLVLTWAPISTEPLQWSVDGRCIVDRRGDVPRDTGRLEIALAPGKTEDGGVTREPCDVHATLERTGRGTLDPAFGEGGTITAFQRREAHVHYSP
jgi:hypothetical protein